MYRIKLVHAVGGHIVIDSYRIVIAVVAGSSIVAIVIVVAIVVV